MRLSIRKEDPDYADSATTCAVYLDDVPQYNAITADEEAGTILRYATDAHGAIMLDPDRPGYLLEELVHGVVRIELRPRDDA